MHSAWMAALSCVLLIVELMKGVQCKGKKKGEVGVIGDMERCTKEVRRGRSERDERNILFIVDGLQRLKQLIKTTQV